MSGFYFNTNICTFPEDVFGKISASIHAPKLLYQYPMMVNKPTLIDEHLGVQQNVDYCYRFHHCYRFYQERSGNETCPFWFCQLPSVL